MRLQTRGMALDLPPGWEARARQQARTRAGRPGNLLLHAATRPMPADRGDFGSGAVEHLGPDDVFVSLFEYDAEDADGTLFEARGLPRVRPSDFSPSAMQRVLPGQSGGQWFFTHHGRPFCLFVVLGSHARRAALVHKANAVLDTLDVETGDHA